MLHLVGHLLLIILFAMHGRMTIKKHKIKMHQNVGDFCYGCRSWLRHTEDAIQATGINVDSL